jgi:RND family efflux transporter MFP subunit
LAFAAYKVFKERAPLAPAALAASAAPAVLPLVVTFTAQLGPNKISLSLPGDVKAFEESPIYARVDGYVKSWLVDIGSRVEIGQLLAEIDAPDLDQQLSQAQSQVEQLKAKLDISRITYVRYKGLLKDAAVSKQEVDNYYAELTARTNDVAAAQAHVGRLLEMTGFKKIYAPYTGTIGARNLAKATTGSLINAGSLDTSAWLYRIYRVDPARVYVAVPQNYLPMIRDGADVEVLLREYPDRIFEGKITRNASVLDPASRTMLVEVQVPNPDNVLLAGMYTTVRFSLDVQQPPIVVPGAAVIMGAEGTRIAVVDKDNVVSIREVRLGRDFGKTVEIVAGCVEGEQIVLSPSDLLRTGQKVRVAALTSAAKK